MYDPGAYTSLQIYSQLCCQELQSAQPEWRKERLITSSQWSNGGWKGVSVVLQISFQVTQLLAALWASFFLREFNSQIKWLCMKKYLFVYMVQGKPGLSNSHMQAGILPYSHRLRNTTDIIHALLPFHGGSIYKFQTLQFLSLVRNKII